MKLCLSEDRGNVCNKPARWMIDTHNPVFPEYGRFPVCRECLELWRDASPDLLEVPLKLSLWDRICSFFRRRDHAFAGK